MLCQICHTQEASVYLIESVENTRTTLHICESCAQKRHVGEVLNKSALALQQLLASLAGVDATLDQKIPDIECPYCGLTYAQFRQTGRLGCEQCYDVLRDQLLPLLRQFHQADEHRGRSGPLPEETSDSLEIKELKNQIQQAVAQEDYELAARLRDQLKHRLRQAGA